MKGNNFRVLLLLLLICSGCVASKVVVEDTTFYSSKVPAVQVTFPDDLNYIGEMTRNTVTKNDNSLKTTRYLFVKSGENLRINTAAEIVIKTLRPGYWVSDIHQNRKNKLLNETVIIDGVFYQEAIYVAGYRESKFVNDKGYVMPGNLLVRCLARIVGSENRIKMSIYYAEDLRELSDDSFYHYRMNWVNSEIFKKDQKDILNGFIKRAKSAVSISKFTEN